MLTELIAFDIDNFENTHTTKPLTKTSRTFIATVQKALSILAPPELAFCEALEDQLSPSQACAAASKVGCFHRPQHHSPAP
ncbi:hypothetical protein BDZ89DRAFT_606273 [Hymenopellis radicata]|nr:hypothetical protein BDZ89DRAFT_606273 [Hymenopellis radicata]